MTKFYFPRYEVQSFDANDNQTSVFTESLAKAKQLADKAVRHGADMVTIFDNVVSGNTVYVK
jgi:hypothetical protein